MEASEVPIAADAEVFIYLGSQTGTAEGFAHELGEQAKGRGVVAKIIDLEDFSPETFSAHRLIVLIVSTTGDGDPTDNAVEFYKWVTNPKLAGILAGVTFAVFGCGDRHYVHFNKVAELADIHMERLGARRLCAKALGDDAGDIRADFQSWRSDVFWPALEQALGRRRDCIVEREQLENAACVSQGTDAVDHLSVAKVRPNSSVEKQPDIDGIVMHMADTVENLPTEVAGAPADVLARFYFQAEQATVTRVEQLRQTHDVKEGESTVGIDFDVSDCPGLASYEAAGTLEVLPENSLADVQQILQLLFIEHSGEHLGIDSLDKYISFTVSLGSELKKAFPTPCTLRDALSRYCDLRRPPNQRMLLAFRHRLNAEQQGRLVRLLDDLASMDMIQDEAHAWTQFEFWSVVGVKRLDLATFLLHCPRQRSRPFTIASSPLAKPNSIHACVALVSHDPVDLTSVVSDLKAKGIVPTTSAVPERKHRWFGLCSHWICVSLAPGAKVHARVRKSSFRLVKEDVPVIMIGSGAGVAPFRAFWNEFAAETQHRIASRILFFGCRHSQRDWLYRQEMSQAAAKVIGKGLDIRSTESTQKCPLSKVAVALSRQTENGTFNLNAVRPQYVQHQLRVHASEVQASLAHGGYLYICGSNRMGKDVVAALVDVLPGGQAEVKALQDEGRIIQEIWGGPPKVPNTVAALPSVAVGKRPPGIEPPAKRRRIKDAMCLIA
jgi:NADPH-ferrihemoprotein reductase